MESQHNSIIVSFRLQYPNICQATAERAQECDMSTKPDRRASNPHLGSDFDEFLREEGLYDQAQVIGALRSAPQRIMLSTVTSKGQVTIPKRIRDALHLQPGAAVEFSINAAGEVVLCQRRLAQRKDCFEAVRGVADVRWRSDALIRLLRAEK
jgi:antitoxin PrlF